MTVHAPALAIVERGYRGAVESQFYDALYSAVELHRQLGGLEVLLRGSAASYAVAGPPPAPVRIGSRTVDTLNDPRAGLGALIDAGVVVWVEEPALPGAAPTPADRWTPGVRPAAPGDLAARWAAYRMVLFL